MGASEGVDTAVKVGLLKRIGLKALEFGSMIPAPVEKVEIEGINSSATAQRIRHFLGNSVANRNKWENPFSMNNVLHSLGYVEVSDGRSYREIFPEVYQKTRKVLDELIRDGVVDRVPLAEPDKWGERFNYRVADKNLLKRIAEGKIASAVVV